MAAVHTAQHVPYRVFRQPTSAERDGLIGQRQCIAHRPPRRTRQQPQRLRVHGNRLGLQYPCQMVTYRLGRHRPQVELQATRQHRDRNLLGIGRRQHELQIVWRFFQRLEHRIECRRRQHVHFVDHEDLEAALHRLVYRLLQQRLHVVDAAVGRCVQLGVVDEPARIDIAAGLADAARLRRDAAGAIGTQAIERLGQDPGHRRLAHATGTGKQVGMVQALRVQRVGQGPHHMLLPHHLAEMFRPVFAG